MDGGTVTDTAVLDLGMQETGRAGAGRWALAVRGLTDPADDDLVTAWTLRTAPPTYRRADLPGVVAATRPWSDTDAAKRIVDGARPLRAAGIGILDALDVVAREMSDIATGPTVEGDMSGALRDRLPEPYLLRRGEVARLSERQRPQGTLQVTTVSHRGAVPACELYENYSSV